MCLKEGSRTQAQDIGGMGHGRIKFSMQAPFIIASPISYALLCLLACPLQGLEL